MSSGTVAGSRVQACIHILSAPHPQTQERLVCYCRTTSASTAPCTSRRTCCPTHCASYCAPCQPLLRKPRASLHRHPVCPAPFGFPFSAMVGVPHRPLLPSLPTPKLSRWQIPVRARPYTRLPKCTGCAVFPSMAPISIDEFYTD